MKGYTKSEVKFGTEKEFDLWVRNDLGDLVDTKEMYDFFGLERADFEMF